MTSEKTIERDNFWKKAMPIFEARVDKLTKPTYAADVMDEVFKELECDFNEDHTRHYPTSWPTIAKQVLGRKILNNPLVKLTKSQEEHIRKALKKKRAKFAKAYTRGTGHTHTRTAKVERERSTDRDRAEPKRDANEGCSGGIPHPQYDPKVYPIFNGKVAYQLRLGKTAAEMDLPGLFLESVNATLPNGARTVLDRAAATTVILRPSRRVVLCFNSTVPERERVIEVVANAPMRVLDYTNATLKTLSQRLDALMASLGTVVASQRKASGVIEEDDVTLKVSPSERDKFFAKFVSECGIISDKNAEAAGSGIYRMYRDYCASAGFGLEDNYAWFVRRMNKHGFASTVVGTRVIFNIAVDPDFAQYAHGTQVEEEEVDVAPAKTTAQTVCAREPAEASNDLVGEIRALREEIATLPQAVASEIMQSQATA